MGCCAACDQGKPCAGQAVPVTPAAAVFARPASPWDPEFVGASAADSGYIVGAGIDVVQARTARRQQPAALLTDVAGENLHRPARRVAKADLPPLHDFRERVNITTGTQLQEVAANDSGVAALPGRYPSAGWDGEMSSASPIVDRGGM